MNKIKPEIGFKGEVRENLLKDLDFAAKNNFDYYEVGSEALNFKIKPEVIRKARKLALDNHISLTLHIPWLLQVGSLIPEISEATLNFIKKDIALASNLGVKIIVLHSGKADPLHIKNIASKNFEILVNNLNKAVEFARQYGIKIGLENLFSEGQLSITANNLIKTVSLVKGLGITFDVGHANVAGLDPLNYFQKISKSIINIHIHDNDGTSDRHNLIGKGNINFKALLGECKKSGYYGPFILEVFPYKNALKARNIIQKIWDKI